jgi:metal-responsive CopG/Arc/MetJ family transcriptional regulator
MGRKKVESERLQVPVVFKLPPELLEEFNQFIKDNPREGNRSEQIRRAIRDFIDERKEKKW